MSTMMTERPAPPARAQTRARYPDDEGFVVRDGIRLHYEVYGNGEPELFLAPLGWPVLHARMWKAQILYLARRHRLVTYDPRGNGRSDRPSSSAGFVDDELLADAIAVLDGRRRCSALSWSASPTRPGEDSS